MRILRAQKGNADAAAEVPPHPALPEYYEGADTRQGFLNELFDRTAYQYRAIDRVVGWIAGTARRIGGALRGGAERGGGAASRPADGSVVATAATTAAGHRYEGRALIAGSKLQVVVQRGVVPAAPAAAASA